ncbi:WD40 repeat-like protein [Linderina pennispora]|uniref:WD40 repeat-like protein n=1 Tax=Linderina pennispora TaxID=61395 RepID=A0A1Y1WM90_9FUNG|nr:WD40 repeat-like protein [Linderina pennispora]ORX74214.1 WD40 repeat-like protein [Linderina pennispora]
MRHIASTHILKTLALSETRGIARTHTAPIHWLSLDSIDSRYLLSGGADRSVHLLDLDANGDTKHMIKSMAQAACHDSAVSCVSWYAVDTGMFATSSYDGTVKVWDTNAMAVAASFDLNARVEMHAMSPTGAHALIAAATQAKSLRLGDLRTGAFAQELDIPMQMCVAWSPRDPFVLASGGQDGRVHLWDVRRADTHVSDFAAHTKCVNSLLFAEHGAQIASFGLDDKVSVWNVQDTAQQAVQMCRTSSQTDGSDLLFVPCEDRVVRVVDLAEGRIVAELHGHFDHPTCTAWRTGRMELYSGGSDSSVLVWTPAASQRLSAAQQAKRQDTWSDSD